MHPKISIVSPSFNQGQFLETTILSVLEQNYSNLEYIIIDGGSKDNSIEIIKKYSKHLTYWVSESDRGQSHAINKGLTKCTGEIFNWLNSDDYLEEGALFKISEAFQNPDTQFVAGKCRKFFNNDHENIIPETFAHQSLEEKIINQQYMQPSNFLRFSAIRKMGHINETLHYTMDYEWMVRYFLLFGIDKSCEINSIIANARFHQDSKTFIGISKFTLEKSAMFLHLCKQLSAPNTLLNKINKTNVIQQDVCFNFWHIKINLILEDLFQVINDFVEPYYKDSSYLYREATAYYSYFGQTKPALKSAISAIQKNPYSMINYKFFVKSLYSHLRKSA